MIRYTSAATSLFVLIFTLIVTGCASSFPYNETRPNEYREHWEGNEDIKDNQLLYPYSIECEENNKTAFIKEKCK